MTNMTAVDLLGPVALAGFRADLLVLASELQGDAVGIRTRAPLVATAGDIAWRSPAAQLYRADVDELVLRVRSAADAMDDLAAAVRRLARRVAT